MKKTTLQTVLEFLLDNVFDFITIGISLYLFIRFSVKPIEVSDTELLARLATLSTWILAVLGMIAVTGIWDRNRRMHRIEKLTEENNDLIQRQISGKFKADDFFTHEKKLTDQEFLSSKTIYIMGITLSGSVMAYTPVLSQRLAEGAVVRIIMVDTTENILDDLRLRSWAPVNAEYYRSRITSVVNQFELIAKSPSNKGKMEIGHLPFIPPYGLLFVDPDEQDGKCFVHFYAQKVAGPNPSFCLTASDDPLWYKFYKSQFELLWSCCRVDTISNN